MGTRKTIAHKARKHLYLIDASGYIFRAYHALPPLTRPSDGLPVGAVAGFCSMLHKFLEERKATDAEDENAPTHICAVFDAPGPTFRKKLYPAYKAHRGETPEDLIPQIPLCARAAKAFHLATASLKGFEADDLIATYTQLALARGDRVSIVSSDKDLMQLVSDDVRMLDTMKKRVIDADGVVERFGVGPDRVVDVQALAGDSSDNIPGAPGIGVKTAALLINAYGDLETLLARAGEIKQAKRRETLLTSADEIRLSRTLVRLRDDVPKLAPLDTLVWRMPEAKALMGFLNEMEFNTLTRRIARTLNVEVNVEVNVEAGAPSAAKSTGKTRKTSAPGRSDETDTSFDTSAYETITDISDLDKFIAEAEEAGVVAVDVETDSLDAMRARLVGVALATAPGRAVYMPLQHDGLENANMPQIKMEAALKRLKPLLEDESVLKLAHNAKYDLLVFQNHGLDVHPLDDTMLISYVLEAGLTRHGMDALAERHFGHTPIPFSEVAGSGKKAITFNEVPISKALTYAAEDADVALRLHRVLRARLLAERKSSVYATLERPLVPILVQMERAGVKVNTAALAKLSAQFAKEMGTIAEEIYTLAGERFNIASPRQLGEIFFDKMSIPGGRKTKSGAWSTDADMLDTLAQNGHELARRVLDWRHFAKLKSTYTDALPNFVNPKTKRVHTSFAMASTTTGRLASSDPNLQNIPIRREEGREIRRAFVAEAGHVLISADYSQIELRLIAHMAGAKRLQEAFHEERDIHAMTAEEIFGKAAKNEPDMRRRAKAINFGIIYGISAFGLAQQLGMPRQEAGDYIKAYFKRFPEIQDYMEETKRVCRAQGYVETIFGRRCHIREIAAKQPARRAFAERAAINAPVQGSAADLIRRAMIRLPDALEAAGLPAVMLLQVHDELLFETPKKAAREAIPLICKVMAHAHEPSVALSVPLRVDAKSGADWNAAH